METTTHQYLSTLAASSAFSGLPLDTLRRLAMGTNEIFFKRGEVVFSRGSPATGIYLMQTGHLKLCIESTHGDEHVVEIVQDGDCFGDAAALTNRAHLVTAAAVSDCRILHIARNVLMVEIERDPELSRRIIRTLSDRLYRRTRDLENVLFRKAGGRVARFILDQLESTGALAGGRIKLKVGKGVIASRLNMTQEHFSRVLRELSLHGQIAVAGRNIDVRDEAALRQLAG